jgi:hypothetical protein
MPKKAPPAKPSTKPPADAKKAVAALLSPPASKPAGSASNRPSALVDTRVIYCGDNLEQLAKLPDACVDLIYIDPPFNSNRNYEVFWRETKEKRAFEDRHASTQAYIDYMRPRCVQLARVLKKTGSFTTTAIGTAPIVSEPYVSDLRDPAFRSGKVRAYGKFHTGTGRANLRG